MKLKNNPSTRRHINFNFDIEYDERRPKKRLRFYHEQPSLKNAVEIDVKSCEDVKEGK